MNAVVVVMWGLWFGVNKSFNTTAVQDGRVCILSLTLAVLGEHAGRDAADILAPDAGVLHLHLDGGQRHHVEVALVGQNHQAALARVGRAAAAEPGHAHPPHPRAVQRRQLQLHLGAHLGQREDLQRERERETDRQTDRQTDTTGTVRIILFVL